ncbi:MAG TPA: hypothetical protein VFC41_09240 [Anaerovoracaceae bacterium]|nr:hypothetical protein [Anaerovoracaceae bacterium]
MKTKTKIKNKVIELEDEREAMGKMIKELLIDPINTNFPRIRILCEGINIISNEIEMLKDFY